MVPRSHLSTWRVGLYYAFCTVLMLLLLEAMSWLVVQLLTRKGLVAYIPAFGQTQMAQFLRERDPLLGWRDHSRQRAFSTSACASAYGNSFTAGQDERTSYPFFLSEILQCPVANYGVSGYGSDQALMLFREQSQHDRAATVILAHMTENILRNVNRYRNLLYPGDEWTFKPRFVFGPQGELKTVPCPVQGSKDLQALQEDPHRALFFDYFLSRPRPFFPYSVFLLQWVGTDFHVLAKSRVKPWYEEFYSPFHPSKALELTAQILTTFVLEAKQQGRQPLVLLIPTAHDIRSYRVHRQWPDQPLVTALQERGISPLHAAPFLEKRWKGISLSEVYEEGNGHLNAKGYRELAQLIASELKARGLFMARNHQPLKPGS